MPEILKSKSIYYSNVNLIAQPGVIKSRSEIPKRLDLILVSPMSAICGSKFVKVALNLGLSVGLHRFCLIEEQIKIFKDNYDYSSRIWAAVGLDDYKRINELYKVGCRNFILDVANGYLPSVIKCCETLVTSLISCNALFKLMAGNVHSSCGINLYSNICENINVRVGISSGSACDTKNMTAVNRGQITEIMECYYSRKDSQLIWADGGINCPAYASLAFACGADGLILGGYFSRAEEAENIQKGEYKFWGSASYKQLELSGSKRSHSEGKILDINSSEVKPLEVLVDELWGGISSAISYSGFSKIEDFIGRGILELKHSS